MGKIACGNEEGRRVAMAYLLAVLRCSQHKCQLACQPVNRCHAVQPADTHWGDGESGGA